MSAADHDENFTSRLQKIQLNHFFLINNILSACVLMKSTAKSLYMSSIVSILAGCWTIVKFWKIGQPGVTCLPEESWGDSSHIKKYTDTSTIVSHLPQVSQGTSG